MRRVENPRSAFAIVAGLMLVLGAQLPVSAEIITTRTPGLLLGIYPDTGDINGATMAQIDGWMTSVAAGVRHSILPTFLAFDAADYAPWDCNYAPSLGCEIRPFLNSAWTANYTPFINIIPSCKTPPPGPDQPCAKFSVNELADPSNNQVDGNITTWARAIRDWASEVGGGKVFLAPMPELNGWVNYGPAAGQSCSTHAAAAKQALARWQAIFNRENVPTNTVRWVFAPNAESFLPNCGFEQYDPTGVVWPPGYLPGGAVVDAVGVSSFNFGDVPFGVPPTTWMDPVQVYTPYVSRMAARWPRTPIFITQTASAPQAPPGKSKSQFIADAFFEWKKDPRVRAILWFNYDNAHLGGGERDWHVFGGTNYVQFNNYRDYAAWQGQPGTAQNAEYLPRPNTPNAPNTTAVAFQDRRAYTFDDVPGYPFAGVSHWAYRYVEAIYRNNITSGIGWCYISPYWYPNCFGPDNSVTRAQMAYFVLRGRHGGAYQPPAASGYFVDVNYASGTDGVWIDQMYREGITTGCPFPYYCPTAGVTRTQMAYFLLRAKYGAGYAPPAASGYFVDVNYASGTDGAWIDQMYREGITTGCPFPYYCPTAGVTRAQMAVFLTKTFNIPLF